MSRERPEEGGRLRLARGQRKGLGYVSLEAR